MEFVDCDQPFTVSSEGKSTVKLPVAFHKGYIGCIYHRTANIKEQIIDFLHIQILQESS